MRVDRLIKTRQDKGITQEDLAKNCGLSSTQIYRIESDHSKTSAEALGRIAKALEVTSDYLLGLSDDPKGQLSEKDLSPMEVRLLKAYRSSQDAHEKLSNILIAITSDEELMLKSHE